MPHVRPKERLQEDKIEGELGFDAAQTPGGSGALPQLDIQTVFFATPVHRVHACMKSAPRIASPSQNGEEGRTALPRRTESPGPEPRSPVCIGAAEADGRVMVKDERPFGHCGLCAETCPTPHGTCRNPPSSSAYAGAGRCRPALEAHATHFMTSRINDS